MKTRIKIVEGPSITWYIAQKRWFFIWLDIYTVGSWHSDIIYAKNDIDRYLKEIAPKKDKITYQSYPKQNTLPPLTDGEYRPMPLCKPIKPEGSIRSEWE